MARRITVSGAGKLTTRPKKCKSCGEKFVPSRPLQAVCANYDCVVKHVNAVRAKREAKEHREAKLRVKPRSQWLREAQSAVNAYVRARDAHLGCISCDKPASWNGQWHASHFRSVGAASSIRFNLWNIHKACSVCNNWLSGNLAEYEPRLRAKIGDERVDWLRRQNFPRIYSIEYLQRLKKIFSKKTKKLIARRK